MVNKTPKPTGKYAVGTFTYTVKDVRPETLPGYTSEERSVAGRVYYPVRPGDTEGLEKEHGISREMAAGLKKSFKIPLDYDRMEAGGENFSECYKDAPVIKDEKFPLIMFSHGYMSYREGNSFLCIELASRGYVVISVAHSHEAIVTEFDDGSSIPFEQSYAKKMYEPMLGGILAALKVTKLKGSFEEKAEALDKMQKKYCHFMMGRVPEWEEDMRAALKYAKENLSDMIDFDKGVGVSGHSLGGAAAYTLCLDDQDFVCGINIDGALFGDHGDKVMHKPFMQINCKANANVTARGSIYKDSVSYRVLFRDMVHVAFSDMKFAIPSKLMVGKLEPELMHENLCNVHVAFFDTYLKHINEEPEIKDNDVITVEKH
jgi:dienelactone hydrolase